jgi:uncharacterized oligopeptide transporter (OPT) family protein
VGIGVGVGGALIVIDRFLEAGGGRFRAHVMPVAVGIYLPLSLDIPILIGGLIRHFLRHSAVGGTDGDSEHGAGVLFGSGLIAGEALMGIALAIPICINPELLPHLWNHPTTSLGLFGLVVALYVLVARRRGHGNVR